MTPTDGFEKGKDEADITDNDGPGGDPTIPPIPLPDEIDVEPDDGDA